MFEWVPWALSILFLGAIFAHAGSAFRGGPSAGLPEVVGRDASRPVGGGGHVGRAFVGLGAAMVAMLVVAVFALVIWVFLVEY